jgi:hypothetical protein
MSASIASVKIVYSSSICSSATGDINTGTWLEAYTGINASGKRLGRLLYAHVKNRQYANGAIINKFGTQFPWYVAIGQVPAVPANQNCYLSTHTHFSIWADTGVAVTRTGSYSCGANLSAGYTPIYWWTY